MNRQISIREKIVLYAAIVAMAVYIGWRLFFTLPFEYGAVAVVLGLLFIIAEIMSTSVGIAQFRDFGKSNEIEMPDIPEAWFTDVDILIATHNESEDLLFKTASTCTYIKYPDKSKVHIYICDDGNRPQIAELAKRLKVGYFGMSGNKDMKAGNLNNALAKTNSPMVVTLDADMIPKSEFLLKTVPYSFLPKVKKDENGKWVERNADEIDPKYKIGYVQTPQSFYNPDLFQYNLFSESRIPNEQDYFFREVNVNKNSSNAAIYAGSNTLILREALTAVGGIATGTITEDFETGIRIQKLGYTTIATSEALANGLAPTDVRSMFKQRIRWGRGCIYSLRREKILTTNKLSWSAKFAYISCYLYWWTFASRLIYITAPIIFQLFNLRIMDCDLWQLFAFWLPSYLLYSIVLRMTSRKVRNVYWSNVIDTILFPYLILPIAAETLGIRLRTFEVTDKARLHKKEEATWQWSLPVMYLAVFAVIALVLSIGQTLESHFAYNIIIMYWLVVNLQSMILAIMFMLGRQNFRGSDRFFASIPAEISFENVSFKGKTVDLSDAGLSVILSTPEYIPPYDTLDIALIDKHHMAKLKAQLVQVQESKGRGWKYSMRIVDSESAQLQEYFQMIYDRKHSLASEISEDWSVFDDFSLNITKRGEKPMPLQRKLPRIYTNFEIGFGIMTSFNYRYVTVRITDKLRTDLNGSVNANVCGLNLQLKYICDEHGEGLYSIVNWGEILEDPALRKFVQVACDASKSVGKTKETLKGSELVPALEGTVR